MSNRSACLGFRGAQAQSPLPKLLRGKAARLSVVTSLALLQGCSTPVGTAESAPTPVDSAAMAAATGAAPPVKPLAPMVMTEADFAENENNRDPFRSFAKKFAPVIAEAKVLTPQYTVMLERFAVEDLKLVAIVRSAEGIRAMFVDPQGKGWTITRGTYFGRGDIVRVGTTTTGYPLHWKVDRIKPDAVVLVREDPMHPELPATYKELPLHVEGSG